MNRATRLVSYQDGKLALTKKEYAILEYMMLHKGKAIATEQLLNHVWDSDAALYPDSLKYHIHSIKKKLVEAGCPPDLIQNIRGVGYKVEETSG